MAMSVVQFFPGIGNPNSEYPWVNILIPINDYHYYFFGIVGYIL